MIPVSHTRLRRLELSVRESCPELLDFVLDFFPSLESLKFVSIVGPPSASELVRPPGYTEPSTLFLNRIISLCSHSFHNFRLLTYHPSLISYTSP
jgi:hypothetical protein